MSILSDRDLRKVVCYDEAEWNQKRNILIENGSSHYLNPMGYDLSIGGYYFYGTLDSKPDFLDQEVIIKLGDLALIQTLEKIES